MKTSVLLILISVSLCTECKSQSSIRDAIFAHSVANEQESNPVLDQQDQPIRFKSVTLAVVLSVLVPGTGELYAGNFETGKYAMMAEAAIWTTYFALSTYSNWVRQDARLFATQHAGASFTSKGDQFDVDMGNYLSVDDYNQAKLQTRDNNLLYTDPSFYWKWDSDADMAEFKSDRILSDQIIQDGKFVIAAAVVNRIFSAFSAGRAAASYNRKILYDGAWNLEAYPTSSKNIADGVAIDLTYHF